MSGIIWGFIRKNKEEASMDLGLDMMSFMKPYNIDNYNYIVYNNIFFGCGIQYITEESVNEILPYHDKEDKLIITADAIIDNRDDLLRLFDINIDNISDLSDSQYILKAYKIWGKKCVDYLVGDFSFVIYDIEKDEVFCAKDHVGKRTFYYVNNDEYFGFCTLSNPLVLLLEDKPKLNERWLSDYLALIGVIQVSEDLETIISDIKQLPFASILLLKNNEIIINKYWDPVENVKPLLLKTEEEYIEKFIDIFKEAVNCRCRSINQVGIKLSSGLDSSSVSVFASRYLKEKNKKLKSYTVVPKDGFISDLPKYYLTNEQELVEELVEYVGNIDPKFCKCENINSTTYINRLIEVLEQPYKFVENSFWMYELPRIASEDNCKVMLTGQFGNATISYGNYLNMVKTFFSEGKIIYGIKEINQINKSTGLSRKLFYKDLCKSFLPKWYRNWKIKHSERGNTDFQYCPINKSLIEKWNIRERFTEKELMGNGKVASILYEDRQRLLNPISLSQLSIVETKIGLALGVLDRDPTRDKRVIEFCMSIPSWMFLKDGYSRYLIRKSMKGYLPDSIRMHIKSKGLQAADWVERLDEDWQDTFSEIRDVINNNYLDKYIDIEYLKKNLENIRQIDDKSDIYLFRMYLIILILYKYLNYETNIRNYEKEKISNN